MFKMNSRKVSCESDSTRESNEELRYPKHLGLANTMSGLFRPRKVVFFIAKPLIRIRKDSYKSSFKSEMIRARFEELRYPELLGFAKNGSKKNLLSSMSIFFPKAF